MQNWRNKKEAPGAGFQGAKVYETGQRLENGQVLKCLMRQGQGLGLCSKSNGEPLMNLNRGVPLSDLHF